MHRGIGYGHLKCFPSLLFRHIKQFQHIKACVYVTEAAISQRDRLQFEKPAIAVSYTTALCFCSDLWLRVDVQDVGHQQLLWMDP